MRAVDDARVALQAVPRSTDDFRTRLVLRSELLEERSNALQAVVGEQANPVAREFCLRRGLRQSASFAPGAYGPDASSVMARAWCHKMQHFLNKEISYHLVGSYEISYHPVGSLQGASRVSRAG